MKKGEYDGSLNVLFNCLFKPKLEEEPDLFFLGALLY